MASVTDPRGMSVDPLAEVPARNGLQLAQAPRLAPKLARGVLVVVFSSIFVLAYLHIYWFLSKRPLQLAMAGAYMLALLGLQLFYFSRSNSRPRPPWSYVGLLVQAALVYLPMLEFKDSWVGLPGFLAGSVLLALPPLAAWACFVPIVISMGV